MDHIMIDQNMRCTLSRLGEPVRDAWLHDPKMHFCLQLHSPPTLLIHILIPCHHPYHTWHTDIKIKNSNAAFKRRERIDIFLWGRKTDSNEHRDDYGHLNNGDPSGVDWFVKYFFIFLCFVRLNVGGKWGTSALNPQSTRWAASSRINSSWSNNASQSFLRIISYTVCMICFLQQLIVCSLVSIIS
jgi:hypothetical protein